MTFLLPIIIARRRGSTIDQWELQAHGMLSTSPITCCLRRWFEEKGALVWISPDVPALLLENPTPLHCSGSTIQGWCALSSFLGSDQADRPLSPRERERDQAAMGGSVQQRNQPQKQQLRRQKQLPLNFKHFDWLRTVRCRPA